MGKYGKIGVLAVLVFICLSPLDAEGKTSEKAQIRDRWAVIVGIDKFQDKSVNPLKNASHNAINLNDFLIARGGYEKDHIKLLVNENATRRNIWGAISNSWLPRVAKPNDLAVIYFSTTCSNTNLDIKKYNYLICHDSKADNLFSSGIQLNNFVSTLKMRLGCDNLLVIIDSDYSGAAQIEPKREGARLSNSAISNKKGGVILLCSCSSEEKTLLSKDEEGTAFTNYLIQFIGDCDFDDPISKIFKLAKKQLQKQLRATDGSFSQNPILKSNWKGVMPSIQPPISESN